MRIQRRPLRSSGSGSTSLSHARSAPPALKMMGITVAGEWVAFRVCGGFVGCCSDLHVGCVCVCVCVCGPVLHGVVRCAAAQLRFVCVVDFCAAAQFYIVPRTGVFTTCTGLNTGLRLQRGCPTDIPS